MSLLGCKPEVGDKCQTSVDCSQVGDRICDVSQKDGYCTVFNCEPKDSNGATKCPDEAVCIVYAAERSPVSGCANLLGDTPYSRSFCMKKCDNTTDCRDGYVCIDVGAPGNPWAAVNADGPAKVCTQPFSYAPLPPRDSDICTGTSPEETGGAGSTDQNGAGGASSQAEASAGASASGGT
jgi:hypothetical protein